LTEPLSIFAAFIIENLSELSGNSIKIGVLIVAEFLLASVILKQ
jgi:hypothetical protein